MPRKKIQKTKAKHIESAERRRKALDLRRAGKTYAAIGEEMGYSEQRAHAVVTAELRRLNEQTAESAAEIVRTELERLDGDLVEIIANCSDWERTNAQGVPIPLLAHPKKMAIMERRAKLLGYDAKSHEAEAIEALAESFGTIAASVLPKAELEKLMAAIRGRRETK